MGSDLKVLLPGHAEEQGHGLLLLTLIYGARPLHARAGRLDGG